MAELGYFEGRLVVEVPQYDLGWRVLHEPIAYYPSPRCRLQTGVQVVEIPEWFQTDYASIPRALWPILPPTGKYTWAAVVHDFLYRTRQLGVGRSDADALFLDAMQTLRVNAVQARLMWVGVRAFGWAPWARA